EGGKAGGAGGGWGGWWGRGVGVGGEAPAMRSLDAHIASSSTRRSPSRNSTPAHAEIGAKGRPLRSGPVRETSADQLCHLNCCGLRADSCEIITLTSAGPLKAIAASSADFRSFGFSTNQPLPPKASLIFS